MCRNINFVILIFLWSLLVCCSATWNLYENARSTREKARVEAETVFQHNLAYRRWNSLHGGVYAMVSEVNKPNPYIESHHRDIYGVDGSHLTIINPFQMTRQAYDLLQKQSPELAVFNRTVSLDPLNPDNSPDDWERSALEGFEEGEGPRWSLTTINGAPYMRLISPYVTEHRCMACHEDQGYKVDDIRGGMSISVPMGPYLEAAKNTRKIIINTHLFLWLLGTSIFWIFSVGLKKYQATIAAGEEVFRVVSEFAYNFEYWISEEKQLIYISPSCERITGYSRKDFLQHKDLMYNMIHPDDKPLFKDHLHDFEQSFHEDMEYRILTKNGETRWLSHVCVPIYAEGKFRGRRGSNIDITDKKRLQENLADAKKVEDIGHFASGVAHDFNNVLTSINTLSNLLHQNIDRSNIFAHEMLDNIAIASKLGQNLTANLLLFGRKQRLTMQQITLSKLINNIKNVLQVLLRGNINFRVDIADGENRVLADHHQIEQILLNLATNARDAMPSGGNLTISVNPEHLANDHKSNTGIVKAGHYMILSVSDTGTGIEKKRLNNILKPFYSTKSSNKGTGLGLAIVNNILKQHKAFMDIISTPGKGTTFKIFFPICRERDLETDTTAAPAKAGALLAKPTILIVDDDWLIRKSVNLFLKEKGYNVLTAEDGEEAIAKYRDNMDSVDMVVLDVMLPKKNGSQVCEALRKLQPDVKVLFISGSNDESLAHVNIHRDTVTLLNKPLDMKKFIETLEKMLKN